MIKQQKIKQNNLILSFAEIKQVIRKNKKEIAPSMGGKNMLNKAPSSNLFKSIDVANIQDAIILENRANRYGFLGLVFISA